MSRWRANPPPRRTARPSGSRRSGDTRASPAREPVRGGARRRPFRESPRAAASFKRRRPNGPPRRRSSPASPPRYGAAERRPDPGGPHSDHTPVLERVLRTEGRVTVARRRSFPDNRPPWRTRGTGSRLGSRSPGASCRTRECGEPRSGADSSAAPRFPEASAPSHFRPRIRRDYPLDLSISASGGKETN